MTLQKSKFKLWIANNKVRISQFLIIIAALQIPILALTKTKPFGVFFSNQTLYYLHGIQLAGVPFLQNDPDAILRSTHFLFSQLVFILETLNILPIGSQIFQAVFTVIFALSTIPIAYSLYKSWQVENNSLARINYDPTKIGITVSIIFTFLLFWKFGFPNGFGNMGILTNYFQPSNFAIFIVLGIGLALLDRWWLATAALIVSSIMHSNFFFIAGIVILVMAAELFRNEQRRLAVAILLTFGLINLPFFILGPVQWTQVNGDVGINILNHIRSPHHYIVSEWWDSYSMVILIMMMLGTMIACYRSNKLLRNIMLIMFVYIVLGILIEYLTGNAVVASLLPWRASTILLPVSLVVIIAAFWSLFTKLIHIEGLFIVLLFSLFWNIFHEPFRWPDAVYPYTSPEIELVREVTTESDLILVPPDFPGEFRLYAERPIYVLTKTNGFDISEWYGRVQFAEAFLQASEETRQKSCQEKNIDYYLLPVGLMETNMEIVGQTDDYVLLACD